MYIPESIRNRKDYQECIRFHGHTCMGVTIGYLASRLALDLLGASPAADEQLFAIVENDACCCDAVQVLTGCTFGKGNFIFRDYGKMVFTFGNRETGEAVRLSLRQDVFTTPEQERLLAGKIRRGEGSVEDVKRYETLYESRGEKMFGLGPAHFFKVDKIEMVFPPNARMAPSEPCSICGEMVMRTKLEEAAGTLVCRDCL